MGYRRLTEVEDLEKLRGEINAVDETIVAALVRRAALCRRERCALETTGPGVVNPDADTVSRMARLAPPEDRDAVVGVFEQILAQERGFIESVVRGVAVRGTRILLCRAKDSDVYYLPGGHIEFGESAREALVRETLEETSLHSRAGEFLGVVENSFVQHGRKHCEINLVYRLELEEGDVDCREDWIRFDWVEISSLDGVKLLPLEMKGFCK